MVFFAIFIVLTAAVVMLGVEKGIEKVSKIQMCIRDRIIPSASILGAFGAVSICMGVGDYYNAIHALVQMPKGSRTYLHKFNSFWYIPER